MKVKRIFHDETIRRLQNKSHPASPLLFPGQRQDYPGWIHLVLHHSAMERVHGGQQ
jgi:hypothetical protein